MHFRYRRIEDTGILIAKNLLEVGETLQILNQPTDGTWDQRNIILEEKRFHIHP